MYLWYLYHHSYEEYKLLMKNIFQALLIIFVLNSCANSSKKETVTEPKSLTNTVVKDVSTINYPLDSLLSFDSEAALKENSRLLKKLSLNRLKGKQLLNEEGKSSILDEKNIIDE